MREEVCRGCSGRGHWRFVLNGKEELVECGVCKGVGSVHSGHYEDAPTREEKHEGDF